ncbi:helix-turn-helix domain-containing protein [Lysinibacillus sp. UBA5990]|uniref:helix-turn-helix domain-containing protein n=1 Tax=Lysinibacillus sp. UBA5990 TaxID=1946773 RepID=UPI0025BA820A|nr:helix-turn-helix domain-containing protein [Lysinibacillus sp. UBA5990]
MNCPVKVRHQSNFYGGFFGGKVSVEQRIQAVKRYLNGYETMFEIAEDIGVTDQVVSEWVRRYQKNGVETFLKPYIKYK